MQRNWRSKLSSGSLIIFLTLAIPFWISTCSLRGPSLYRIHVPKRPVLSQHMRIEGEELIMRRSDWARVRIYYHTLERELRAACIANGQPGEECLNE